MTSSHYILPHDCDPALKSSVFNSVPWHLNPEHCYNFLFCHGKDKHEIHFVSLLPNRCVLFNNSYHNNLVCSVRTPYFGRKSAFTQSCITLQPLQLLKKYFGELWPRSWLFGGIHFLFSIVNFIFHHFCTTLCHLIVILPLSYHTAVGFMLPLLPFVDSQCVFMWLYGFLKAFELVNFMDADLICTTKAMVVLFSLGEFSLVL